MERFNMIGIGERAGSGVLNIFQTWDYENWMEPVIDESFGILLCPPHHKTPGNIKADPVRQRRQFAFCFFQQADDRQMLRTM